MDPHQTKKIAEKVNDSDFTEIDLIVPPWANMFVHKIMIVYQKLMVAIGVKSTSFELAPF